MRFTSFSLLAVSAFAGFGAAMPQASATTSSAAAAETTVDPNSVTSALRNTWCRAQQQSCPTLCGGSTTANDCDISTLTFNCTCASGTALNVSDFTQTLPSLECEYAVAQCTQDHPDDAEGQATCQSVQCGSKNVTSQVSSSSSSAVASATASSTSGGSSSSTSATPASSSKSAAAAGLHFGKNYGSGALVAGLLALFGFAL